MSKALSGGGEPMDVVKTIRDAEEELASLNRQLAALEPLLQRRKAVEGMLFHLRKLAPQAGAGNQPTGEADNSGAKGPDHGKRETRTVAPEGRILWSGARDVVAEHGRPMQAGAIVIGLQRRGWQLSKHAKEVVRGAINRRPDIFTKTPEGYGLKEWETQAKVRKLA